MDKDPHALLFERKDSVGRINGMAYLHRPYSPKLTRRVKIYTPMGYDHWVTVEVDPSIATYNEDPPAQRIPFNKKLITQEFEMACKSVTGQVTLRRFLVTEVDSRERDLRKSLDKWADEAGLLVETIDPRNLTKEQVFIENWKDILLFIDASRKDVSPRLEELLLDFVIKSSGVTFGHLQVEFSDWDPTVVGASIGRLLMSQRVSAKLRAKRIDRNLVIYPR